MEILLLKVKHLVVLLIWVALDEHPMALVNHMVAAVEVVVQEVLMLAQQVL